MSLFALADAGIGLLAIPEPAVGQAPNDRPGVTPPKVDLPAEIMLSAKFPTLLAVGLFARK